MLGSRYSNTAKRRTILLYHHQLRILVGWLKQYEGRRRNGCNLSSIILQLLSRIILLNRKQLPVGISPRVRYEALTEAVIEFGPNHGVIVPDLFSKVR